MSSPSLPRSPSSSSLSSESSLSDSDSDSGSESCSSSPISSSESTRASNGYDIEPDASKPRHAAWYFPAPPSPPASPMGGSGVVRWQGPISIRQDSAEDGVRRTSWVWKNKWLALTATSLTLHQWEPSPQQWVVPLCDVTVIARSDLTPYCLLLETQDLARWYLSFKHEEEMRDWLDDISSRSPGASSEFVSYFGEREANMAKLPQDAALGVLLEEADTTESLPANPDGDTSNAREFTNLGRIHPSGQRNIRRLRLAIPAVPRGRPPNPQQRQQEPPSNRPSKEEPVKQGPVSLAEDGSFASGIWKTNWLVLTDKSLSLSRQESVIPLCDLVTITRVPRKPYCVVLKTQDQRQRYLAFINEVEMHGWWDAIASRVPGIERPPLDAPPSPRRTRPKAPPPAPTGPRPHRASRVFAASESAWEPRVESAQRWPPGQAILGPLKAGGRALPPVPHQVQAWKGRHHRQLSAQAQDQRRVAQARTEQETKRWSLALPRHPAWAFDA